MGSRRSTRLIRRRHTPRCSSRSAMWTGGRASCSRYAGNSERTREKSGTLQQHSVTVKLQQTPRAVRQLPRRQGR